MDNLKETGYKNIKNFFTQEELLLLKPYCINQLKKEWTTGAQSPLVPQWYKDPLMNVFLKNKISLVEINAGLKLFPTYAFWRAYMYGSSLKKHTDREACEISVTVNLDSCGYNWPIFMGKNKILLEPGDGVIYLGCEIPHYRKIFKGDYCAQVFFHYVDQNGPYKNVVHEENNYEDF